MGYSHSILYMRRISWQITLKANEHVFYKDSDPCSECNRFSSDVTRRDRGEILRDYTD